MWFIIIIITRCFYEKKSLLLVAVLFLSVSNKSIAFSSAQGAYDFCKKNLGVVVAPDMYGVWIAALLLGTETSINHDKNLFRSVVYTTFSGLVVGKALSLNQNKDVTLIDYVSCVVPFVTVFTAKALGKVLVSQLPFRN